jgi:SAM-dependent methyltransferase
MLAHNRDIKRRLRAVVRTKGRRYFSGRLVDIGCGVKPYERDLQGFVAEHVGVDYGETQYDLRRVDIVATAYEVPVPDESFDCALATEVLEHLEDPVVALAEWRRIVRPGGHLLVTTPFMWGIHDQPRDFYRYSPYGLRHVLERGGWEVVEVTQLGGFWSTFGQLFAYVLATYGRGPIRHLRILPLLGAVSQRLGSALEHRSHRPKWGSHVVAVARRP